MHGWMLKTKRVSSFVIDFLITIIYPKSLRLHRFYDYSGVDRLSGL